MANVCERCGRSNRLTAMFCIGCTGRLPGFVPSGPSALEDLKALSRRTRSAEVGPGGGAGPLLPSETKSFWFLLGAFVVLMTLGFMGWFLHVKDKRSDAVRSSTVHIAEPAERQLGTEPVVPPLASTPTIPVGSPSSPAPLSGPLSTPRTAVGSLPVVPTFKISRPDTRQTGNVANVSPRNLSDDPQVQAVEKFYRALSDADGKKAAAMIIPAKRGTGPFNEANISRFYGSMRRPLLIRSIRPINASLVEAKYSYRVSSTTCEGTAIVETQRMSQDILIRSIRANC